MECCVFLLLESLTASRSRGNYLQLSTLFKGLETSAEKEPKQPASWHPSHFYLSTRQSSLLAGILATSIYLHATLLEWQLVAFNQGPFCLDDADSYHNTGFQQETPPPLAVLLCRD